MRLLLLILPAIFLCHCGAPQPPSCGSLPYGSRVPSSTVMETAKRNWLILADPNRKSDWPLAETAYNEAVAILFDKLRCGSGDWTSRAAKSERSSPHPILFNEDLTELDALFPADCRESPLRQRITIRIPALGIPAVAWQKAQLQSAFLAPLFSHQTVSREISRFSSISILRVPQWKFPRRWIKDTYTVGGVTHGLAADWTAPVDFFWYMCDLDNLRIQNVFLPERFTEETGLYFLEEYDPDKIPVIMVHGLVSSPDAYRNIINNLSPEPWFRENYQVWLYNYPTGTPWLYNAMRFRQLVGEAGNLRPHQGAGYQSEKNGHSLTLHGRPPHPHRHH